MDTTERPEKIEASGRVELAAARALVYRHRWEDALREGRAAGLSLRHLAALSGVSYETVRRIVSR